SDVCSSDLTIVRTSVAPTLGGSARDALALHAEPPKVGATEVRTIVADLVPSRDEENFERLEEATLNDLAGRAMSQTTRDIYHQVRDYLAAAAKELAERESTELDHSLA